MNNLRILSILCLLIWTGSVNGQNSGSFVDSRDSRTYKWVQMGEQIWMAENLKFQADSGAVCYDNNLLNCEYYGVLYKYETAIKVCPNGWHLPSDKEWMRLEKFIGMSWDEVNKSGWRGENEAYKLKSKFGWTRDGNGCNEYGFNVLPAGVSDGNFILNHLGIIACFWISEYAPRSASNAIIRKIRSQDHEIGRMTAPIIHHLSVRCVKDE